MVEGEHSPQGLESFYMDALKICAGKDLAEETHLWKDLCASPSRLSVLFTLSAASMISSSKLSAGLGLQGFGEEKNVHSRKKTEKTSAAQK